jgi:hypothetical protein
MDSRVLSHALKQVYLKYPDLRGVTPQVKEIEASGSAEKKYSLIFKTVATTANQKKIIKYVRATVNEQGKIIRISTSR